MTAFAHPAGSTAAVDALLSAMMSGHDPAWPDGWASADEDKIVERARYHGICGMLVARKRVCERLPSGVHQAMLTHARAFGMWEVANRRMLATLADRLSEADLRAFILKGGALAYTLYDNPAWRERGDSDILIDRADRERISAILLDLGYRKGPGDGLPDRFVLQESWSLEPGDGTSHDIDLHFSPMNYPAYERRLAVSDAASDSVPIAALGGGLSRPSFAFLLLHACLHRRAHERAPYMFGSTAYFGANRLIWLQDIALLIQAMDPADWGRFVKLAIAKKEAVSALDGLAATARSLDVHAPAEVIEQLKEGISGSVDYFGRGALARASLDIAAIADLGGKTRYLAGRLFPNAAFMRAKYPGSEGVPLALLYVRRMIGLVAANRLAH